MAVNQYELGTPIAEYPFGTTTGKLIAKQFLNVPLVALGLGVAYGGLRLFLEGGATSGFGIILLVVGLLLALTMGSSARKSIRNRNHRVLLFDDGFIEIKGKKRSVVRWDDISEILQAATRHTIEGLVPVGTSYSSTVKTHAGSTFTYAGFHARYGELGETIQRAFTSRELPRTLDALQSGSAVAFGKFELSAQGVRTDKGALNWGEVESIAPAEGMLFIRQRDERKPWHSQNVAQTPNFHVLNAVLKQYRDS